jgi:site-specific recombinase XerD
MSDIIKASAGGITKADAQNIKSFVDASVPHNTARAYRADWADFVDFCTQKKLKAMPADAATLAAYLTDSAGRVSGATLRRRLAAIKKAHALAGHNAPTGHAGVAAVMKGINRTHGQKVEGKDPIRLNEILEMVGTIEGNGPVELRDRALLLVGFAGAFRRSELGSINAEDLEWRKEGVVITLNFSKTDQEGVGRTVAIPFTQGKNCAATALKTWLMKSRITEGPVFRGFSRGLTLRPDGLSGTAIAELVKKYAQKIGIDPDGVSAHSLRAGHVTEARALGVSDADTMAVTGHKRRETLDMYDRRNNPFARGSAGAVLGGLSGKDKSSK